MRHLAANARPWAAAGLIAIGILARFVVMMRGHNYDFDSFAIVGDLAARGLNVYANTHRYNYGPVWFIVLGGFYRLAPGNLAAYRILVVAFLTLVDVGILLLLMRLFGRTTALVFFLNPISIIITGYHNQFDNLALLLGLMSVTVFGDSSEEGITGRKLGGLCILGLSLMTKHILFAFPIWLAVKQKGLLAKGVVIGLPIAIFLLGFAPYISTGREGILHHVFMYASTRNAPLYATIVPALVKPYLSSVTLWLTLLGLFGIVFKKRRVDESLLLYTAVLVAAAPSAANQYLAIPVAFTALNLNLLTVAYTALGTLQLAAHEVELHFNTLQQALDFHEPGFYAPMMVLLLVAVTWDAVRPLVRRRSAGRA
jgi:hypothetical protein